MRGDKHVKVKKRRRQDILRFCTDSRKLILGSIGTPLDHLSANLFTNALLYVYVTLYKCFRNLLKHICIQMQSKLCNFSNRSVSYITCCLSCLFVICIFVPLGLLYYALWSWCKGALQMHCCMYVCGAVFSRNLANQCQCGAVISR